MHGLPLAVAIILFAAFGSSAAEGQMDEKTLCPAAIRAFDGKDSAQTPGISPVCAERFR